jgi:hypothetical protein
VTFPPERSKDENSVGGLQSVLWRLHGVRSIRSGYKLQLDDFLLQLNNKNNEQACITRIHKQGKSYVRFEVFTAVTMKNGVFWDVTLCGSCKNRRFGGTSSG